MTRHYFSLYRWGKTVDRLRATIDALESKMGRECEGCGRTFNAYRIDQRYCSPRCRQRAYRRRHGLVTYPGSDRPTTPTDAADIDGCSR